MAFTSLMDGGLSVRIGCASNWTGGDEFAGYVRDLEFETTEQGCGAASFYLDCTDPHWPITQYGYHLWHGKRISITHTVDAVTRHLYKGFIISDPRSGTAGETGRVTVECGGPLEVAKARGDWGITFSDCDYDECWVINKRNNKIFQADASDCLELSVDKGEKVPNSRAGIIGYVPYLGAQHLQDMRIGGVLAHNGVMRMEGEISCNLGDRMRATLFWSDNYNVERNMNDSSIHVIHTWGASGDVALNSVHFDTSTWWTPTTGRGYLGLAFWCNDADGRVMTKDRFFRVDNVRVYTSLTTHRLDQAMSTVADFIGLHTSKTTTAIDTVDPTMVVRPMTDPGAGLGQLALQADNLVKWGWWPNQATGGVTFQAGDLPKDVTAIRALANCFKLDAASLPGNTWDVQRHPELWEPKAVRIQYGRQGRSAFPAGTPATAVGPVNPGWSSATPFLGATSQVLAVDFTSRNWPSGKAQRMATKLFNMLTSGASGTVTLKSATLPIYASGTWPCAYVQGGDFIEFSTGMTIKNLGPLYITRSHVVVATGEVTLDVGFAPDKLLEQLQSAGAIVKAKLHSKHRRRRR